MIPTIEQIVEDLLAGTITKAQATTWLHQHTEDAGRCLRDEFATAALPACIGQCHGGWEKTAAETAYRVADAMLAARDWGGA